MGAFLAAATSLTLAWWLADRQRRRLTVAASWRHESPDGARQQLDRWRRRVTADHLLFIGICPTGAATATWHQWQAVVGDTPAAGTLTLATIAIAVYWLRVYATDGRYPNVTATARTTVPVISVAFTGLATIHLTGWLGIWALWAAVLLIRNAWLPRWTSTTTRLGVEPRSRLETLRRFSGVGKTQWLVEPASDNASATGGPPWQRVVLGGRLMTRLSPAELDAVVAHELGHVHLYHRLRYYAPIALGYLPLFLLLGQPGPLAAAIGLPEQASATERLTWLLLMEPALAFLAAPLGNLHRRHLEFEADRFATRLVPARHLASALERLTDRRDSEPSPDRWYDLFTRSYPTLAQRQRRLMATP